MTRHEHHTLDRRRKSQAIQLTNRGRDPRQAAEMLELYLGGDSAADIAEAYQCTRETVYRSICKEALFQLMEQRQVERLEELDL